MSDPLGGLPGDEALTYDALNRSSDSRKETSMSEPNQAASIACDREWCIGHDAEGDHIPRHGHPTLHRCSERVRGDLLCPSYLNHDGLGGLYCPHADAHAVSKQTTVIPTPEQRQDLEACVRCALAPGESECCSSHQKWLCHKCYRETHFVEGCFPGCSKCQREGLLADRG